MPSPDYNDGTVQYGSRVVTVNYAPPINNPYDTYVCDGISIHRPTKKIKRTNEEGKPSGSVGVPDFVEGSLQGMQLASGSTKEPLDGMVITITLDAAIGSETFFLTDVVRAEGKDVEKKFNCNLQKKYN